MEDLKKCCICGCDVWGLGHNPWPIVKKEDAVCCDFCDSYEVMPARFEEFRKMEKRDTWLTGEWMFSIHLPLEENCERNPHFDEQCGTELKVRLQEQSVLYNREGRIQNHPIESHPHPIHFDMNATHE